MNEMPPPTMKQHLIQAAEAASGEQRVAVFKPDGGVETFRDEEFAEALCYPGGLVEIIDMDGEERTLAGEIIIAAGFLKVWMQNLDGTHKFEGIEYCQKNPDGSLHGLKPHTGGDIRRVKRMSLTQ